MLKGLLIVAAMVVAISGAPQGFPLPPGVPESCRGWYPNCPSQLRGNGLHDAAVVQHQLAAIQHAQIARAPFVPIVGPAGTGVINHMQTVGASGEVVIHN